MDFTAHPLYVVYTYIHTYKEVNKIDSGQHQSLQLSRVETGGFSILRRVHTETARCCFPDQSFTRARPTVISKYTGLYEGARVAYSV
jgi:hypothetical protein